MAKSKPDAAPDGALTIEQLKEKYETLKVKQTQAETRRDAARENLDKLRREARAAYGTDDVAELQAKLAAMTQENEAKRAAYQASLAKIETDLAAVEQQFAAAETAAGEGRNGG